MKLEGASKRAVIRGYLDILKSTTTEAIQEIDKRNTDRFNRPK